MKKPTSEQLDALLQIAASTDALFMPMRPASPGGGNIAEFAGGWLCSVAESRQLFGRSGVPFAAGGSMAERQAAGRLLASLATLGLATVYSATWRRIGVSLTDRGDLWIRGLSGGYTPSEAWTILRQILKLTDAGCVNAGHVSESDILGVGYDKLTSQELVDLEHRCIPLLVRGWLTSSCDGDGRVGYSITDLGRTALARTKPRQPRWLPMPNDAAFSRFSELYKLALADRQTWKSQRSHVLIPLGAGSWPERPEVAGSTDNRSASFTSS